ncbi:MAG: multicopper oxidase family protein [Candidatus Korobacteraceae bacterium]
MASRRDFLAKFLGAGAGLAATPAVSAQQTAARHAESGRAAVAAGPPVPVLSPDLPDLPFRMDNGVKVFQLIAEPVRRELLPGRPIDVWGFNGSCPGPTIQMNQGDRVRIVLENRLPEPTSIHWHGFEIPIEMDGMPYISQKPVPPGERFTYEFTLRQQGTFFYHAHSAMQEMMGMIGMFVMHPQRSHQPRVDHDFGIILQGWALLPNNTVPNSAGMEFNWLTFNGRSGPHTTPMLVKLGSRVRMRFVNLGMDHHPIHLHGHTFQVTGTEGGRQPESVWGPANTVLVGVAQAREVEFVANNPGDWMVHCHLPHHMMNAMSDLLGERMITTSPLTREQAGDQMKLMHGDGHARHMTIPPTSPDSGGVPGFPQDAFMEMPMDELVQKPENHGLPPNWTSGMMGMMTLLRVLPEDRYDEIMAMKGSRVETPAHRH